MAIDRMATFTQRSSAPSPAAAGPQRPATVERDARLLEWAATVFAAAVLLHNGDHLRRGGDAVDLDVFVVGSLAILIEVALVVLAFQRHRLAALAAAVNGLTLAAGYLLVHVLPERSWLSDPLFSGGASRLSQTAAIVEIAAAVLLGAAGLTLLRRRGGLASAAGPSPVPARALGDALRHPVVVAMIAGNLVVVVGSFATL